MKLKTGDLVTWNNYSYYDPSETRYKALGVILDDTRILVLVDGYPLKHCRHKFNDKVPIDSFWNLRRL